MTDLTVDTPKVQAELSELFGSYKAEWLKERLFDLFTEPTYFPELMTARPCVLVGGRGTGKTTVLRCLSYEGQFALDHQKPALISQWQYYGFYYRVNTNRVTAFQGSEASEAEWQKLFAHYSNLLLCGLGLRFLRWHKIYFPNAAELPPDVCERVAASLNLVASPSVKELTLAIDRARVAFEAYINNIADGDGPPISLQGAPIDTLFEGMSKLPQFAGREFFFLIDEYENFLPYQQRVFNTLIKHSGQLYTFKIGVRELGWKTRITLNETERLNSPADYVLIDISQKLDGSAFAGFAAKVCNGRISRLSGAGRAIGDITSVLPGLSEEEEAVLLGVEEQVETVRDMLLSSIPKPEHQHVRQLTELELYYLSFWSETQEIPVEEVFYELQGPTGRTRFENYKYALLFTIRRRKGGIRKYYAGWSVFLLLAANNIRYLLELVEQSLVLFFRDTDSLSPIPQKIQTLAAQAVGRKNLGQLEGSGVEGAKLTKLLLGLGRVFQVMAADARGHAPEVNQFHITSEQDSRYVPLTPNVHVDPDELIRAAVMHLALLRTPGNKLSAETETQEYDYMVHPIYSPFFVFSHRRKRKMNLSAQDLAGLVAKPRETIRQILLKTERAEDEPLPEQLALFEAYYAGSA